MRTMYERLGETDGIRALVDDFYDRMDRLPDAAVIRAMHPPDLSESRNKLHLFLCQWTGGPATYSEQRGHPRMRARHLPFAIDDRARDAWLMCMGQALEAHVADALVRDQLFGAMARMADHMRNQG